MGVSGIISGGLIMRTPKKSLVLWIVIVAASTLAAASASNAQRYDSEVRRVAGEHNVPPELVHAIIKAESSYDSFAVSNKGAMGLMQLMPATAHHYGVNNVFDPKQNIEGGVRYLKDLIKLYEGRTSLVLAAYNAGQAAVEKYGGIPPYQETRNYIRKIQAAYTKTFITPPKPKIYKFRDANGRLVLTTDPHYMRNNKDK